MSREKKVNPGKYTQAGRLTPDDTARELKKQRELASPRRTEGNPHPFHTAKREETSDDARAVSSDEKETGSREVNDEDDDVER